MGNANTATVQSEAFDLPEPTLEEAKFFLRELDWGEHLPGVEMNPAAGNRDMYLYSLKEVALFLRHGTAGMGFTAGGRSAVSWLDVNELIAWTRTNLKDSQLADELEKSIVGEEHYHGQVQKLGHLIEMRYAQFLNTVDTEEATSDEESEPEATTVH